MSDVWGEQEDGFEHGNREVEEANARRLEAQQELQVKTDEIRKTHDITKRARELFSTGTIQFKDVRKVRQGDMYVTQPLPTDENKWVIMNALFDGDETPKPHLDEFKGRIVDHEGRTIDDHYPVVRWVETMSAGGLKGLSAIETRKCIREWALEHRWNDLIQRLEKEIPEWDGKPRMRSFLIELFEAFDTELNRDFGEYFWLSLYSRLMMPGTQAPMVLSLFGVQNCGKSYFGKRLCSIITGDDEADSVQLDLGGDKLDFLREITGQSIVAAVGEMTGFTRGDLNKIKDFITRTSDKMHYKFEGHFSQLRQWVTIMDGNKYEGLQRDDTGNRRFYPMFCGQKLDQYGKTAWREDFRCGHIIASSEFENDIWQLLAEAAAWFEANGVYSYDKLVANVGKKVFEFSMEEMKKDSGTIRDDVFDTYLEEMLRQCPKFVWTTRGGQVGVGIKTGEFKRYFQDTLKHTRPNWRHLKMRMLALGAVEFAFTGGYPGYFFPGFSDIIDFKAKVGVLSSFVADGESGEEDEGAAGGGF